MGHIYEWVSDMNDGIMVSFYLLGVATSTGCPQAETVFFWSSSERPKPVGGEANSGWGDEGALYIGNVSVSQTEMIIKHTAETKAVRLVEREFLCK